VRAAAIAAIVASIRSITGAGAPDSHAFSRETDQVARIASSCSNSCPSCVARRVSVSFHAASLERIRRQESLRMARAFSDGDDASACVVPTRRRRIHSRAAGSWASMSSTPRPVGLCSMVRNDAATCSARCAISGTGIAVTVGWTSSFCSVGRGTGCADAGTTPDPHSPSAAKPCAMTITACTRTTVDDQILTHLPRRAREGQAPGPCSRHNSVGRPNQILADPEVLERTLSLSTPESSSAGTSTTVMSA